MEGLWDKATTLSSPLTTSTTTKQKQQLEQYPAITDPISTDLYIITTETTTATTKTTHTITKPSCRRVS